MADLLEARDRAICEMWNDGARVGDIGWHCGVTDATVYAVTRRRRLAGWDVRKRHTATALETINQSFKSRLFYRASLLESLATEGRIDPARFITTKQAALLMGVSVDTLYREARRGRLRFTRPDNWCMQFNVGELIDWAKGK